ncbi:MAG TPA: hypothetical protein VM848_02545 [Acidimicrobiia bacterium]|nr:hypothetical protein [Acidimicrobiia bacterium]
MVPFVDTRETELHGLNRLQNDFGTKALFLVLSVPALFSLAAIFAQPARADLLDAAGAVADQTSDVIEDTTTTVIENDAAGGEENAAPLEGVGAGVIPPVSEEAIEVVEDVLPVVDDVLEVVADTPPVVEVLSEVVEVIPPVVEDLLVVVDATPIVEIVEDLSTVVEIVEEVRPVVTDVVIMTPPLVLDVVRVLPLFVPNAVVSPGPSEVPSVPVPSSNPLEVSLSSEPAADKPHQLNGLFMQELVAEMTSFHLADLTSSLAAESPASTEPDADTPGLAPYKPIAGLVAVVGGSGSSASSTSSHSGSSFFGGLDAFSFFAAMAALLALCLVGWIRDRSRSGRSIFPSHGGRPG